MPEIKCNSVVFPDPLGPMIATRSPWAIKQRRHGEPEIGTREMKLQVGNCDHSFLRITAALHLALPIDVHGRDLPCAAGGFNLQVG